MKKLQRSEQVDFLILLAVYKLATFLWLAAHTWPNKGVAGGLCFIVANFITTTLVTTVGKIHLYAFCPSSPLCNVDKTLSSNTSFHFTIFQHWTGEWGCWHLFSRYYGYEFMFLAFSLTICPWLSEFSYILNAHNLHWNLQIRTKCSTCTIYQLLNKMTANIWLWPNSLTLFATFIFLQNWGFWHFNLM